MNSGDQLYFWKNYLKHLYCVLIYNFANTDTVTSEYSQFNILFLENLLELKRKFSLIIILYTNPLIY